LYPENLEGFFFAMFTIAISACETAVAIAIVINIYRNLGNVEVESIETIQEPENNPQNLQL
jgi:NADH-quinone oxidoreductase subunit K